MLENVDQFTDNQRHQAVQHVARGDGGRIIFTEKLGGKICQPVIFLRAEYQIIIVGGLVVQRFDKKGGEIIVLSDALEKGCIQVFSGNQEIDQNIVLFAAGYRMGASVLIRTICPCDRVISVLFTYKEQEPE